MRGKHIEGYRRGEEVMVTDADVLEMDGKKMDDYLDWYQRTWIDDRPDKSMFYLSYSRESWLILF